MNKYEIEIKSLLGSKERADDLKNKLKEFYPKLTLKSHTKQLNHYFNSDLSSINRLKETIADKLSADELAKLEDVINTGRDFSVRTRDEDGEVYLVIKASMDDSTSSNGVFRIEFEAVVDLSLSELDQTLIDSGMSYQAKWSREREMYNEGNVSVSLDKNAGYGYLAEFEKMVDKPESMDEAKKEIKEIMERCGVVELSQDRIERMFSFYNDNWGDYYGTDKIFNIE